MERLYVEKMKLETEKELKIHKIQLKKGLIEMTKKWQSSERSTIKLPKLELTKFDGNILKCNIFQIPSKQQPITINHFKMFSNQTTYEHNYVIKQRTLSLAQKLPDQTIVQLLISSKNNMEKINLSSIHITLSFVNYQ